MEIWKQLEEAPQYEISNTGRLRHIPKQTIRNLTTRKGYVTYSINANGKIITLTAHRLVAKYFLPEPAQYILDWAKTIKRGVPFVNHKDGNTLNNHVDNLEWCTAMENTQHAINNDLMSATPRSGKIKNGVGKGQCLSDDQVREIRELFKPYDPDYGARALGEKYGVTGGYISNLCNGTYRKHVK